MNLRELLEERLKDSGYTLADTWPDGIAPEIHLEIFDPRDSILVQADKLVNGPRRKQYAHPADNFGVTARLWSAYLGVEIDAKQAVMMHALAKIAREEMKHKVDNLRDAAGYLLCAQLIEDTQL